MAAPDLEQLVAAMYSTPWDDAPRLEFASRLESDGQDARADFIRADIELAATRLGDGGRDDIIARRLEALDQCRPSWWEEIKSVQESSGRGLLSLRCGFTKASRSPTSTKQLGRVPWLQEAHETGWLQNLAAWIDGPNLDVIESWGGQPAVQSRSMWNLHPSCSSRETMSIDSYDRRSCIT